MNKIIARFATLDTASLTALVGAVLGMVVAFHWLPKEQAEAGGVFVLTLLAMLKPNRKKKGEG